MRRWFFLTLIWVSAAYIARGQQFSLRQYTVVDGLPQSQVNVMIEDKQGYLWIGTNGGLARFDGRDFKTYNTLDGLQSNFVISLMIDQNQHLWIIHPRGLTRFDGISFKQFQPSDQSTTVKRIRRLFELQDSVVILSSSGELGKIFNDSVHYWSRPVSPGQIVFSGHRGPLRDVFFYLNDSSFLVVSPKGEKQKISHKQSFSKVYNVVNFRKELLVDTDSGFFSLDVNESRFRRRSVPVRHHLIAYDSLNEIYWTREEGIFFRERMEGGTIKVDTVFRDIMVTQILFDAEGITWFGTSENGLYKYFNHDFEKCLSGNLKAVMAIEQDNDETTWIGSETKGLWSIRKGKVKRYPLGNQGESSIYGIKKSPAGEVWVASSQGLGHYRKSQDDFLWYQRKDGLSSQYVVNVDFDEQGGVWCGTSGYGVNYFDGRKFTSYSTLDGLLSRNASAIRYFPGNHSLYVGSESGLSVIHDHKVSNVPIPEIANTSIISIHPYNDSLLMLGTTGAGIVLLDPVSGKHRLLTTKDGLSSNFIYFVAEDADKDIWVGSEKGITRLGLNEKLEISKSLHYGYENGLTGLETNQDAFFLGKEKYFGLIDGVYQYDDYTRLPFNTYDLHLTDVELFYGEFSSRQFSESSSGFFQIPDHPSLPPDKNHITFRFNRVEKRYPQSIKYRYKLEGFDKTWSLPTSQGQMTYSNIPPGDYTFHVMATNNRGQWDAIPLHYPFVIQAPFYRKPAFLFSVGVLVTFLVMLGMRLNVRRNVRKLMEVERIRQREQDSLRKEIARDFHDEMGNQLTRIIHYVSLMKLSGNGQAKGMYDKVEESAKYLYTGTRDFIWSIDPVNDELSKVFIHIRDFGEKLFEEKGIQFRAFNEVKSLVRIPYGFSREVNLILKEAMTNAFNHSRAANVSFTLRMEGELCELRLSDDGQGFDLSTVNRNGIKNMQARAERMGAKLEISSTPQGGTTLRLLFPKIKTNRTWQSRAKREF